MTFKVRREVEQNIKIIAQQYYKNSIDFKTKPSRQICNEKHRVQKLVKSSQQTKTKISF